MKNALSSVFWNSLTALSSSNKLLLSNFKSDFSLNVSSILRSLILSLVSFVFLSISLLYLFIYSLSALLDYCNVDLNYRAPIYASITVFICVCSLFYISKNKKIINKQNNIKDLRNIARYKKEISGFYNQGKAILENPTSYVSSLYENSTNVNLVAIAKYKSMILITCFLLIFLIIKNNLKKSESQTSALGETKNKTDNHTTDLLSKILSDLSLVLFTSLFKDLSLSKQERQHSKTETTS